jgi:hypothetical protein
LTAAALHPILAWDPIGIGDTLTGAALGALGLMFLITVAFWTEFFTEWPWTDHDYEAEALADRERHITRGVIICDWVDAGVLASVAKQKGIEPDPDRLERGDATTHSGGVEGGRGIFKGRFNRERKRDERGFYELTKDPNALLVRVFSKVHQDGIDSEIDSLSGAAVLGDEMLNEIVQAARGEPEIEAARDAVRALQAATLRQRVADSWGAQSTQARFVLIESEWDVKESPAADPAAVGGPGYELRLRKLRQLPDYETPRHGGDVDMPEGLGLGLYLTGEHVTEPGKSRLRDGTRLVAGVFGTTAQFDAESGLLTITPIAVFSRVESTSRPSLVLGC